MQSAPKSIPCPTSELWRIGICFLEPGVSQMNGSLVFFVDHSDLAVALTYPGEHSAASKEASRQQQDGARQPAG
jgi:hypothetical protein